MSELKPGQTVLVYAEVRKVDPGTEGAMPVVQVSLTPAEGFSQQRDITVMLPLAKVHSIVGEQEPMEYPAVAIGHLATTRAEMVKDTIKSSRPAPNASSEFLPGQTMTRIDRTQATELSPAEAVEASQYVRAMPGCDPDFGADVAAALAIRLMAGEEPSAIEGKYLRGWLREQGKVPAV